MSIENMGVEDLANILEIHRNTLTNKLNEESDFTLREAEKIHAIFRKYNFAYIFAREASLQQTGS